MRHHGAMVEIGSGAQREVQEYWLSEAQALDWLEDRKMNDPGKIDFAEIAANCAQSVQSNCAKKRS